LRVSRATSTKATAEVESGALSEGDSGAWAFVTERTYGDLALRVRLDPSLLARDREGLERVLMGTGIIEITDGAADVVIADRGGLPVARTVMDELELAIGAVDVVRVVEDGIDTARASPARRRWRRRIIMRKIHACDRAAPM
jgi:hypothetical protein